MPLFAPLHNDLLDALPSPERVALGIGADTVTLMPGQVLHEPGHPIAHLHFPLQALVSLICTMENGTTAGAALIGRDGVVGLHALFGAERASHRSVVQIGGCAVRIAVEPAQKAFRRGGAFQQALLRYTQSLLAQMAQTAVCNALHPVEKRLGRWLLLMRDRLPTDEIRMTQDVIAHLLGVRREGVTGAARRLQAMGLISYARGHIVLRDRRAIEAEACECCRLMTGRPVLSAANDAVAPGSGPAGRIPAGGRRASA
jgi:CRP-like cAMP-binding protein